MGRSQPMHYVLVLTLSGGLRTTPSEWRVKERFGAQGYGKPTVKNIDKWVTDYENSLRPGECNAHLGIHTVVSAHIFDQRKGQIVARWFRREARPHEPMFQVI